MEAPFLGRLYPVWVLLRSGCLGPRVLPLDQLSGRALCLRFGSGLLAGCVVGVGVRENSGLDSKKGGQS